jgi:hypothetical protein
MIPFFRKIRKQLADDNKPLKYFRYAVGEIILVVIGILIALQINNWNEYRKDRQKEKEILISLKQTLESNLTIMKNRVEYFNTALESSSLIIKVIDSGFPDNDSLGFHYSRAVNGYGGADVISFVGYEVLKNNGLGLIEKNVLKDEILQLFETTYRNLISFDNTFVLYNPYYKEVVGRLFYQDKELSLKPYDFKSLFGSKSYYSVLSDYHFNCLWMKEETAQGLSETRRVLKLIAEEINKFEQ